MGLFSRANPPTPPPAEQTQAPAADIESVATRVVEMLKPMFALQQQPQVQQQAPQPELDDDDTTPEERTRIGRIAGDVTRTLTGGYADVFNMTMPTYARDNAVAKLTPGERIIYEKYRADVDSGVDRACSNNPALKAIPAIHENAIKLVLGGHTSEIAELAIKHMTAEELPATFSIPNTTNGGAQSANAPTKDESEWVSFFAPRSRNRNWDVDQMRYYKNLNGKKFLHELVAEHKAHLEGQQK